MLYMSLLSIDPRQHGARRILGDYYRMHQRLLRAWGEDKGGRMLFRLEETRPPHVLVQSTTTPDWEAAFPGGLLLAAPPQVKTFEPWIPEGARLRFYLRANPTKRLPGGGVVDPDTGKPKDGKRVGLERPAQQEAWLHRQGAIREQPEGTRIGGFAVEAVRIRKSLEVGSWSKSGKLTHQGVDFEGLLRVTDAEAFRNSLTRGIGAGKGFGFGLLTVGRPGK